MALKAHLEQTTLAPEGRRQPRRALHLETSGALPEGISANVTIHNISAAGLLLETELPMDVGEVFQIDLPNAGPTGVEIVWQSGRLSGCAFEQALGEAALAAAELRGEVGLAVDQSVNKTAPSVLGNVIVDPLGVRLNRIRRERGMTLAQVANSLGVSKPTVWAWEKGKARPLPERIEAIAQVLGVGVSELQEDIQGGGAAIIEECRIRIAEASGADPRHVRIMIEV